MAFFSVSKMGNGKSSKNGFNGYVVGGLEHPFLAFSHEYWECLIIPTDLEHPFFIFPYFIARIIPTDELIFFRGVAKNH